MRTPGRQRVFTALAILLGLGIATAQRRPQPAGLGGEQNVEGSLTVTMIIASSVGMVMGPDGQEHLVMANMVDPADNVSRIEYVRLISAQKKEPGQSNEQKRKLQSSVNAIH